MHGVPENEGLVVRMRWMVGGGWWWVWLKILQTLHQSFFSYFFLFLPIPYLFIIIIKYSIKKVEGGDPFAINSQPEVRPTVYCTRKRVFFI